jgi:hypothetical protein
VSYFLLAIEHEKKIHARFHDLILHRFLDIITSSFAFLDFFHRALMHNYNFGQIHYVEWVKKIHAKFTLYFSNIYSIFYEFWNSI